MYFKSSGRLRVRKYLTVHYSSPDVRWEFLHPKLPIIKVTTENSKIFPLTIRGDEHPDETEYSVSFVISFQNRWASLSDPNRWAIRFEEEVERYLDAPSEEKWQPTDYMPHRIIGPVVVQIYDSEVFQPGIYSVTPKVTQWETPGYVATDEQILKPESMVTERYPQRFRYIGTGWLDDAGFKPKRIGAHPRLPNANWPFPGHVVTDEHTQPGTKVWDRHNTNENDW